MTDTQDTQAFCDDTFNRAVLACFDQGATAQMVFARAFTTLCAYSVLQIGSDRTAAALLDMSTNVKDGVFHGLTGEGHTKN